MSENMPNMDSSRMDQQMNKKEPHHFQMNGLNSNAAQNFNVSRAIPKSQLPPSRASFLPPGISSSSTSASQISSKNSAKEINSNAAPSNQNFQDIPLNDESSASMKNPIFEFVSNLGIKINQLDVSENKQNCATNVEKNTTNAPSTINNINLENRQSLNHAYSQPKHVSVSQIQNVPLAAVNEPVINKQIESKIENSILQQPQLKAVADETKVPSGKHANELFNPNMQGNPVSDNLLPILRNQKTPVNPTENSPMPFVNKTTNFDRAENAQVSKNIESSIAQSSNFKPIVTMPANKNVPQPGQNNDGSVFSNTQHLFKDGTKMVNSQNQQNSNFYDNNINNPHFNQAVRPGNVQSNLSKPSSMKVNQPVMSNYWPQQPQQGNVNKTAADSFPKENMVSTQNINYNNQLPNKALPQVSNMQNNQPYNMQKPTNRPMNDNLMAKSSAFQPLATSSPSTEHSVQQNPMIRPQPKYPNTTQPSVNLGGAQSPAFNNFPPSTKNSSSATMHPQAINLPSTEHLAQQNQMIRPQPNYPNATQKPGGNLSNAQPPAFNNFPPSAAMPLLVPNAAKLNHIPPPVSGIPQSATAQKYPVYSQTSAPAQSNNYPNAVKPLNPMMNSNLQFQPHSNQSNGQRLPPPPLSNQMASNSLPSNQQHPSPFRSPGTNAYQQYVPGSSANVQNFNPLMPPMPNNVGSSGSTQIPDGRTNMQRNKYPVDPLMQPQAPYEQKNFIQGNHMGMNSQQQAYNSTSGVVHQGFNKLWGSDNFDLLQQANILPPNKLEPPQVLLGNETLNLSNCSPEIFRSTITAIPESASLLQKSRLPLGILIHPFKDLTHLAVVQCNVIVRCRACRTYINPFVTFVDTKRWKCNLCYRVNELPEEFKYDPISKTYGDPSRRPEIKTSTIEYIAPAEYMLRPPQPAVYLFLLDISRLAVESGYLDIFCSVLLKELEELPGDSRTQVGFIAYDSTIHFYSFADGLSQPHEMIVLDIDDVFLPHPDTLLVNLKDRKELLKDFLNQLPNRYANSYDTNSSLGSALQAGHKMISATGGRITVFQASLPNIGPGMLTHREDPNQRASNEVTNLKPANDFYKRLALECSSHQIAVDLFIVNSQYVDIATISGISRFSGGCIHHFPLFKSNRPILAEGFHRSLKRYLTRKIGFEAVMRVRCTRGLSIHTFHGNFFVRSTDLLSLPNVNPDSGYGMQVSIEENLSDVQQVCFQVALLYTSSKGERRIRVHTLCLPVVSNLQDVINSADQECIIGLLAKMAVDRSMESSLADAREAFINVAIDILSSYKMSLNMGSAASGLLAPSCLKLLPLFISALLKNPAFRTGTSTRLDDRVKAMIDMKTTPLQYLMQKIYPHLYPLHNIGASQIVLTTEEQQIHVPPFIQLTSRLVDSNGVYLMDCGEHMIIYVCSAASLKFINEAFGVPNFSCITDLSNELPILENPTSQHIHTFLNYLNDDRPYPATIQIIKDNSPQRTVFLEKLVEDRFENALSYHEFLQHVKAQVK